MLEQEQELDVEAVGDIEIDVPPMEAQLAVVDLIENHGYTFDQAMKIVREQ